MAAPYESFDTLPGTSRTRRTSALRGRRLLERVRPCADGSTHGCSCVVAAAGEASQGGLWTSEGLRAQGLWAGGSQARCEWLSAVGSPSHRDEQPGCRQHGRNHADEFLPHPDEMRASSSRETVPFVTTFTSVPGQRRAG